MLSTVIDDGKTAITSLGGAIGGVASDKLANYLIAQTGLGVGKGGLGDVGLRFIVRAATTSVVFGGMAYLLPNTAENIFFSIVFFAGNRALVSDAVLFGNILVGGVGNVGSLGVLKPNYGGPVIPPGQHGGGKVASSGCACTH